MNLTLIFLVLSAFIAYLLYDMFKKSRQQQQLAQAQQSTPQKPLSQSRIKINYQSQCAILHQLHEQQLIQLKHKNISIHLKEEEETETFTNDKSIHVTNIIKTLTQTHNVYLLVCRKNNNKNQIIEAVKKGGAEIIHFDGNQGAVAVLRQLNCGTHLEGDLTLHTIIVQYLPVVWLAHPVKQDVSYQFKTELEMILNLELSLKKTKDAKED